MWNARLDESQAGIKIAGRNINTAGKKTESIKRRGRGWDVWIVSLTQQTWICKNSGREWMTEEPGILQSMDSQIVGVALEAEQQQ